MEGSRKKKTNKNIMVMMLLCSINLGSYFHKDPIIIIVVMKTGLCLGLGKPHADVQCGGILSFLALKLHYKTLATRARNAILRVTTGRFCKLS